MTAIALLHSTGHAQADCAVEGVVSRFENAFLKRVVGYFVEGSYADQTAIATSDLDLTIVFREQFTTTDERQQAHEVAIACCQLSTLELDITLAEEEKLRQGADPMFKLGARLLYGQDTRDAMPLIPMATWARQRMHAAYWLMINVFNRPQPVVAPLAFPDPQDPFYGYAARMMRLADGSTVPTTRNLIRVTGWIATARLAYEAQHYVVRKRDCVPAYRRLINDEWTTLLEQIDQRCRSAWRYRIPQTSVEQTELRLVLTDTLRFENHFLQCYREFLLGQLTGSDQVAHQEALRVLSNTFYADPAIMKLTQVKYDECG
jgi:hypothetical protein